MFGGEGGVDLTHLTTGTTLHLSFQTESKLLTGQASGASITVTNFTHPAGWHCICHEEARPS